MDQALEQRRKADEREAAAEKHLAEITGLIRRAVRNRGYGKVIVEIYGGHVKRVVYERSINRPEDLRHFEPESLASGD